MHLSETFLLAQTVVLVLLSLFILYPVVAHAQNVMHTDAIVLLAVSLLVFTASSLVEELLGLVVIAELIHTVSDVTFVSAIWLFAREFVGRDGGFDDDRISGYEGGFEDADD